MLEKERYLPMFQAGWVAAIVQTTATYRENTPRCGITLPGSFPLKRGRKNRK